jgi:hypothetical protein
MELEAAEPSATISADTPGEHAISRLVPDLTPELRQDIHRYYRREDRRVQQAVMERLNVPQ